MNTSNKIDYSIIIPVYYNEGMLKATMDSLKKEVIEANRDYNCEIIFVDDGSADGSLKELLEIKKSNSDIVKIIKFTRNFGQINAITAGFRFAEGKCVLAISADGQDPPELINDMLKYHFQDNYEVVLCTREGRDESFYRVITSKFFYFLMKSLAFPNMPAGGFDFFLLGKRALDVFLKNQDATPFIQGQILWMGFDTKKIEYKRRERKVGKSKWTFGKKITYLIDGILNYSYFPIRFISVIGLCVATLGFLYAVVVLVSKIVWGNPLKGWAPLMIVILVLCGTQMLMLGIIGEYLWRAFAQVKNRESYVIDRIYE